MQRRLSIATNKVDAGDAHVIRLRGLNVFCNVQMRRVSSEAAEAAHPPPPRPESRREAILDAAQTCFLTTGYGATSMSTIAECVGGSKTTLYQYFSSKAELFEAVVRRLCGRLKMRFGVVPQADNAREQLTQIATGLLRHLLTPETTAIYRLVVAESERFPTLGRLFYEAGPRAGAERTGIAIRQLIEQGSIGPTDAIFAAQQFGDLVLAGLLNRRLLGIIQEPTQVEIVQQARNAVDAFLRIHARDN